MNRFRGYVLGVVICLCATQTAVACAFHSYTPNPTIVDVLLSTEQAVIARPDPADPTRFLLLDVLLGPEEPELNLPVTDVIRKALRNRPNLRILIAREGLYGPWVVLGHLDERLHKVIVTVAQRQSIMLNDSDKRSAFFAKLISDPSPDIRRLALQELDRIPYASLRKLRLPSVPTLTVDLTSTEDALTPIRVLLAGLSDDPDFEMFLISELDRAAKEGLPYTGAYATALIELTGPKAVEVILTEHLAAGAHTLETQIRILEALAIQHKVAPRPTRRKIARGVAQLLRMAPELRAPAARFFGFR